ncbi:MAG: SoxR reducing system RseC family protein [Desulfosoma sp.]
MPVRCATVLGVSPGRALVVLEREENCHACHAHSSCMRLRPQGSNRLVEVRDPLGACVGDRVEISFPAGPLWIYSILFFGLPAAALALGSLSAFLWGWTSTAAVVAAGAAGLIVALAFSFLMVRKMAQSDEVLPILSRILVKEVSCLDLG